jgi:hypothetical protein
MVEDLGGGLWQLGKSKPFFFCFSLSEMNDAGAFPSDKPTSSHDAFLINGLTCLLPLPAHG